MGQKLVKIYQGNLYVKIADGLHDLNGASTANLAEMILNQQSHSGINSLRPSLTAAEGHQAFHHVSLFAHMR